MWIVEDLFIKAYKTYMNLKADYIESRWNSLAQRSKAMHHLVQSAMKKGFCVSKVLCIHINSIDTLLTINKNTGYGKYHQ